MKTRSTLQHACWNTNKERVENWDKGMKNTHKLVLIFYSITINANFAKLPRFSPKRKCYYSRKMCCEFFFPKKKKERKNGSKEWENLIFFSYKRCNNLSHVAHLINCKLLLFQIAGTSEQQRGDTVQRDDNGMRKEKFQ